MDDNEFIGKVYTRWTIIKEVKQREGKRGRRFLCKCECGVIKEVNKASLVAETSKSCGCLTQEKFTERATKHGMYKHPLYNTWKSMKNRCLNKNDKNYSNYGGRGITMNPKWIDVRVFIKDMEDVLGKKPKGKSIDRIDNDKGYFIENIRYADASTQSLNQRHKEGKLGIKNIIKRTYKTKDGEGFCYQVSVSRNNNLRSVYVSDLKSAIKIKDIWLEEYKVNKEDWISKTINNEYLKEVVE